MTTSDLAIGYKGKEIKEVSNNLNFSLKASELVCLLGPNGVGKSTLMRTMAGVQKPLKGNVQINGKSLIQYKARDLAKVLSIVLTERITNTNFSVYALVAMGRYPHTGWMGGLTKTDEKKVQWALFSTGMEGFANRKVHELSDGERQKVMIARALAQDTPIILLDEPTAHLDLPNRVEIVRLLRQLTKTTGKAILLSTHELDLALQGADKIMLMHPFFELTCGVPEDLVLSGVFEDTFKRDGFDFDKITGRFLIHKPGENKIKLKGDQLYEHWTRQALERENYSITKEKGDFPSLEIIKIQKGAVWKYTEKEKVDIFLSIGQMMEFLRNH
ncbi:MAG: ABC transporter ATP-binding protein [Flammeovirgaceae bacterium]|nr:ABC transporter ATP-binding protein [Flammeovirgaceae bacterium]